MKCEGILKYRVRQNLQKVFNQRLIILDWDTHKTKSGKRPDAVFLNDNMQLIVVEFELELNVSNIYNSLIKQAWDGAQQWYENASQADIPLRYEYAYQHRFPNKGTAPDIYAELGLKADKSDLWNRLKKVIVVAAAPQIDIGVTEAAREAVKTHLNHNNCEMPVNVLLYKINTELNNSRLITGADPIAIYDSPEIKTALPEGPGLPTPRQHQKGILSFNHQKVEKLLPIYISDELQNIAGYELMCNSSFIDVLKLKPWHEYDADVCFEYSHLTYNNEIEGPHCQLRIGKLPSLGTSVRKRLAERLSDVAIELGCKTSDLECKGSSWPLKQYLTGKHGELTAEKVAPAFAKFCSVVYPIINDLIREGLS